ncbi:MAG: hypothetical protein QOG99_3651 [Frankiales bacterium]|jgi:transcriptional regulator with GAF, ATPase, and Fis domain|nr:hypothetical protein [Frankiales bacterium]
MVSRERQVTEAFVSLARSLAAGYDVVDLLSGLVRNCVDILDVGSAGILLADGNGVLHVVAASSEHTRELETFQVQRDEGPCRDCYRTGQPVAVADLAAAADSWPEFVPHALAAGFQSVHAVPLHLRDTVLGALGLFGPRIGQLNAADLSLATALADVASVALVQDRLTADWNLLNEQLQAALSSRVVLEQAKGILAQHGNLDMEEAFNALRWYARDHNLKLGQLAASVVARSLPADSVLQHARGRTT